MNKTIAIIKGDGIGPEIVTEAMGVLDAVAAKFGHTFTYVDAPMGGTAIDKFGVPLPDSSLATCRNADSVLLGAVGGPKWDDQPAANRPERGLLKLREGMGFYTNVRPAKMFSELSAACPLRADIAEGGIDLVVVRELIGGVYFGEHRTEEANGEQKATDIMAYSEHEIKRVARVAFETARKRRNASPPSTRPTCSTPRVSGARRSQRSRRTTLMSSFATCMSTTRRCSSCVTRASSTSS